MRFRKSSSLRFIIIDRKQLSVRTACDTRCFAKRNARLVDFTVRDGRLLVVILLYSYYGRVVAFFAKATLPYLMFNTRFNNH